MRLLFSVMMLSVLFIARPAFACPDIDGLVDVNCDGKLVIYTFGDSITQGYRDTLVDAQGRLLGYPGRMQIARFPHAEIRNVGKRGETTADGVIRSGMILPGQSDLDYFILLEGTNDYFVAHHFSPTTKNNLLQIFRNGRNTGALTLLANLTDTNRTFQKAWVTSVNEQIQTSRQIDFYALGTKILGFDGIHPTGPGYQSMAGVVAPVLIAWSNSHRPIDSDGDGLYDFEEPQRGTNASVADSDGDGILDGIEVWTYHSNPLSLDSDGDGLSDNFEVFTLHSDPASALPGPPVVTELVAVAQ